MASYGDFSSLLQLGVGVGIGLSLFRAPVDLRVAQLDRTISGELSALKGSTEAFGRTKRRDLSDLRFRFTLSRTELQRSQIPYMVAAVISAVANLVCLIIATVDKDKQVHTIDMLVLMLGFIPLTQVCP